MIENSSFWVISDVDGTLMDHSYDLTPAKETIKTLSLKFPSVLKVEINNISYLKSFLKKERKTTSVALVGPGAGSNTKTMKFTEANKMK